MLVFFYLKNWREAYQPENLLVPATEDFLAVAVET
jgi:hypothetical protein